MNDTFAMSVGHAIRLVVLDRGGVISPAGADAGECGRIRPDSLEAIARLNHAGLAVVMLRGEGMSADEALAIRSNHESYRKLHQQLARAGGHFDGIFFCPHAQACGCDCRLPGTALLCEIAQRFAVSPGEMLVIAAGRACVEAAGAFGAALVRLEDAVEGHPATEGHTGPKRVFANLNAAVAAIFAEDRP